jgi:hypothetical protein
MPKERVLLLGFWLYRQEENRARTRGSLSEY